MLPQIDPEGFAEHVRRHRRFIALLGEIIEEFDRPRSLFPPTIAAMKARSLPISWFDDHVERRDARSRAHLPRRTIR